MHKVIIIYIPSQREKRKGRKEWAKWKIFPSRKGRGEGETQRGGMNESNQLQWKEWKSNGLDVARNERN